MTLDEAHTTLGLDKPVTLEEAQASYEDFRVVWDPARLETDALRRRAEVQLKKAQAAIQVIRAHFQDDNADGMNLRGLAHLKVGQLVEAVEAFTAAIEREKNYRYYNNRGLAHIQLGNHDDAMDDLKLAAQMAPDSMMARDSLARLHLIRGNHALARKEFDMSLKYEPDRAAGHYGVATSWALDLNPWHAAFSLMRAIRLDRTYRAKAETDPDFDGVRDHGAYKKRLKELD